MAVSSSSTAARDARALTDTVTRLRRALRRSIRRDYPWELRPMAQVEVLQAIGEAGTARIGDLAERLRLAQSTVSALVGTLITGGLVTREVDPGDRRASVVALTSDGRQALGRWDEAHRVRMQRALRALPAEDRTIVLGAVPALRRLVDLLDAEA
jgi:DNA-binding MarR family transcriptional regulator